MYASTTARTQRGYLPTILGFALVFLVTIPTLATPGGGLNKPPQSYKHPEKPPQTVDEFCEGFVIYTLNPDGTKTPGPLKCNGICPDGKTRCSPQSNKDKSRTWCGCKDLPEPTFCHLVQLKVKPKQGKPFTTFSCPGPCPTGSVDICRPQERRIKPNKPGGNTTIVITCECLEVGLK